MRRVIPFILLLTIIGGGYYWWTNRGNTEGSSLIDLGDAVLRKEADDRIAGSGTIEAEIIAITTETGGRIIAIHTDEGEEVEKGDLLVELDTSLLQANQDQLEAALDTARANLAQVSAPPRPEEVAAAEAELLQAHAARYGAYAVWQEAQSVADNPLELNAQVRSARRQIEILEKQVEAAQAELKEAEIRRDEAARNQLNDEAITLSLVAIKQAEAARASLSAAEAEVAWAWRQLEVMATIRDNPLLLITQANAAKTAYEQAQAAVLVANANLTAVKADPMAEDVAIARAQVEQAEAALARTQVQLEKMNLTAPSDGIITDRPANPGELATPGAILLNLGDLDQVTLTVFIPETQIGLVDIGQTAQVKVDAYPDETFEGTVKFIALEAEFTPKNVQTEEERVNLVFAVKINLENPDHRLKPGMPADAEILSDL
jgi:multidrug resistance efflux pump